MEDRRKEIHWTCAKISKIGSQLNFWKMEKVKYDYTTMNV